MSQSSKRLKLERENASTVVTDERCKSPAWTANQVENGVGTTESDREKLEEAMDLQSDSSEDTEERVSDINRMSNDGYSISDAVIFKYCLGGLADRALLLKEVTSSASEQQLLRYADEVSLYSGCLHHRQQIINAKRLIEEGTNAWNSISQKDRLVPWENVVFEIEGQFMKTSCCSTRSLTEQDFELLRRIGGCSDYVAQENFERMWCWLYPIAVMLSIDLVNTLWKCTSPKWIEGFISKEEAEFSLRGPRGLQEPGTFILRFPTSRSWPHPDAGSLIVTYVGRDHTLHHRLLSLDHIISSEEREPKMKSLQDMLLAEPELSRLGRFKRR